MPGRNGHGGGSGGGPLRRSCQGCCTQSRQPPAGAMASTAATASPNPEDLHFSNAGLPLPWIATETCHRQLPLAPSPPSPSTLSAQSRYLVGLSLSHKDKGGLYPRTPPSQSPKWRHWKENALHEVLPNPAPLPSRRQSSAVPLPFLSCWPSSSRCGRLHSPRRRSAASICVAAICAAAAARVANTACAADAVCADAAMCSTAATAAAVAAA